ncbi:predicted protein [Micromonas commoda]|uniref:Cyclic nucleotide-binding domain-containing protein n=1 Tax=Micromonas commoda (strain RCC299 / NOUM17 / CCMP2709) TaxID=296587 RepID=C1E916_MICCC|nr:predicted protein [Micromonas commoda]ACO64609.1 predicted protein [Micromonas commoda]|eukprot:XP_002503351.1 predicted protein [Micromonas commoda]
MGASKEVESLAARLEDFPGFDEMRAGSAAGSSCGETPMKDGGGRGPPDIVVASDLVRSESDDVSDFQDATLVEIMRERIQELERENVALRWRERTAEARIEAEIAKAATTAAELAAENSHAELERRLESMAHALDIERQRRQTAERDADLARGVGEEATRARRDELDAAVAAAVTRERERSAQTLRRAAEAAVDATVQREPSSKEQELALEELRNELVESQRQLVRAREDAVAAATRNVGAAIVADALKSAQSIGADDSTRELLADVDELGAAMRAYTAASASLATPQTRKVDGDEEIALARELLLDVPSLAPLMREGKRADVLATFARVRVCVPGESLFPVTPVTPVQAGGDTPGGGSGVDMYIVAEGSVEIAPVAVNPFDDVATRLASSGVVVPRTYVAHPGDVIGEVAAVVDALAGIRTRASLPNGVGLVAGEDLPRRAPARATCSNDGPARLFVINSRDVERVLVFGGSSSFAEVQGGERSIVGTLHAAVATRLAELEASANMSVDGVGGGGGKGGGIGVPAGGGSHPAPRRARADLNAPTTARDARYPLGVRWSEEQLRAAGLRRTAGALERVGEDDGNAAGKDAIADARETVAKVSKSLRAAAARLRERRFRSLAQ